MTVDAFVNVLAVWNSAKYLRDWPVCVKKPLKHEATVFLASKRLVRTIPTLSPSPIKRAVRASWVEKKSTVA